MAAFADEYVIHERKLKEEASRESERELMSQEEKRVREIIRLRHERKRQEAIRKHREEERKRQEAIRNLIEKRHLAALEKERRRAASERDLMEDEEKLCHAVILNHAAEEAKRGAEHARRLAEEFRGTLFGARVEPSDSDMDARVHTHVEIKLHCKKRREFAVLHGLTQVGHDRTQFPVGSKAGAAREVGEVSRGTRRTTRPRPASAGAARVATTTVRSKPRQTRPSSAGPVSHRRRPASAGVTRTATTVRRPASAGVTRAVTTTVRSKPQPARPSSVETVVRNIGSGNTAWQTQPNSPQPISIRDRRGVGLGLGSDGLRRGSKQRGPSALWHPHLEIEGPIRHPQNVKPPPDNNDLQNVNGHYDTANESSVRHKPMKFVTSSRSRFNGFAVIDAAAQNVELERDDQQRDRVFDVTKPLSPELPHPNSNRTNPITIRAARSFGHRTTKKSGDAVG